MIGDREKGNKGEELKKVKKIERKLVTPARGAGL
jgi:hypothetical protein